MWCLTTKYKTTLSGVKKKSHKAKRIHQRSKRLPLSPRPTPSSTTLCPLTVNPSQATTPVPDCFHPTTNSSTCPCSEEALVVSIHLTKSSFENFNYYSRTTLPPSESSLIAFCCIYTFQFPCKFSSETLTHSYSTFRVFSKSLMTSK